MQQPETQNECALQLPAEFSRDELGRELPFFHFKSLLLVYWLPLAWLRSTKGMQLDGDAERNHSFLSPRWGRLASARAFLALWPFPSLLFSTHVLLFFSFLFFLCALYFLCHALLFNMHDKFYSHIYAPSTLDRLFPGAGPLLPWRNNKNEMPSSFICYTLQLEK